MTTQFSFQSWAAQLRAALGTGAVEKNRRVNSNCPKNTRAWRHWRNTRIWTRWELKKLNQQEPNGSLDCFQARRSDAMSEVITACNKFGGRNFSTSPSAAQQRASELTTICSKFARRTFSTWPIVAQHTLQAMMHSGTVEKNRPSTFSKGTGQDLWLRRIFSTKVSEKIHENGHFSNFW